MERLLISTSDDVNSNLNAKHKEVSGSTQEKPTVTVTGKDLGIKNSGSRRHSPIRSILSRADKSIEHEIENIEWPQDVKLDRLVESAWAVLLSWYGETTDVVFRVALPGSTATVSVGIEGDMTFSALQHQIMLAESPSASPVARDEGAAEQGWQSQSLLMVQSSNDSDSESEAPLTPILHEGGMDINTYAVTLHCQVQGASLHSNMSFDSTALSEQVAMRVIDHFGHILRQICCCADMTAAKIRDLDAMTNQDLRQVWTWNAKAPEEVAGCVHHVLSRSVARYPNKTAICAWDGELTYAEWDKLSTRLAHHMIQRGIGPGDVVPLIFEKSMWVPVAQFAVMKAGAASVVVDPSQTKERIKTMMDIVGAEFVLCGTSTGSLVSSITENKPFMVKWENVTAELPRTEEKVVLPTVQPSDLLYVVFTSGTTGNPKGAAITHSNFTSAIRHQNEWLDFTPTARVAGFVSYAFDVSWSDFIHTLAAGATLCIPSEHDRIHDLVGWMSKNEVTFVHLTPSVAAIWDLDKVATLDTVALIGEVVDFDKLPQLRKIKTTIVTYGPAECTVTTTGVINNGKTTKATIGWALGSTTWVAAPDKDSLTPVGLVGELLLEGPLVGAGYINNPEKTASSFIQDPSWLLQGFGSEFQGRRGRLYRTGDLVRYTPEGELVYLGRKDTQVKINGQRTELGDVEHHVCKVLSSTSAVADVIAEVVTPKAMGHSRAMLVAFLLMPHATTPEQLKKQSAPIIQTLQRELPKHVPSHMVPQAYFPMADLPRGLTGKTDRRALREMGARLDRKALAALHGNNDAHEEEHVVREPTTETEALLRELWALVLPHLSVNAISTQDNFFRIGGDSLAAIRLVTELSREGGIWLTVPDIYAHPQLSEMARYVDTESHIRTASPEVVPPFSLLEGEVNQEKACQLAAELCSIDTSRPVAPSEVEDIFPCTALQEGLLAMTAVNPGKYVGRQLAELKPGVDTARLRTAWQIVAEEASILRTRIVDLPGQGLAQVVLRNDAHLHCWTTFSSLDEYRNQVQDELMTLGTSLTRLAIIHDGQKTYLGLTQHHATYDGASLDLLQSDLETAYMYLHSDSSVTLALLSRPMQPLIKHITSHCTSAESTSFWQRQFNNLSAPPFPALPSQSYTPRPDTLFSRSVRSRSLPSGATTSNVLRTAWATLLSWYTSSTDVVFGAVVSGRQAPVQGVETIAGPTIATVPVRVLVQGTVDELLARVQAQAAEMIPYEQVGLSELKQLSHEAKIAVEGFQSLLLVHPPAKDGENRGSELFEGQGLLGGDELEGENTYAMMLAVTPTATTLELKLSFDSVVVEVAAARKMLSQLEHILSELASIDTTTTDIGELGRVGQEDLADIWKWNATVPEPVDDLVHHVFAQRVADTPDAPAVCAHDGDMTYAELDRLSTLLFRKLAGEFSESGLGIVPLCFEKSMWVPVAIFAVMKAGGACVALDTTLPPSRLEGIVGQLGAKVMLTSSGCAQLASDITSTVGNITRIQVSSLGWESLEQLSNPARPASIDPSSPLYIVFTSGSTGAPKGATVTHGNFCSAIRYHQPDLGFERSSRVYDYTSYAFDVTWSNMLHTLTVGACLCIPSEDERTADINGSITRLQANFIHLTPTVGRLLDPVSLKGQLKKVLFIGEPLKASDVAQWEASGAHIYNTYGPAECTVTSTVELVPTGDAHSHKTRAGDPGIGKGTGCVAWVVQPGSPDKLAAVGTIGELWLEGPIVGAGYLNNPDKTAAAFVDDPKWLVEGVASQGIPGRRGKLYRTGDLVYYRPDGSLGFVGRNDTQVKINGQRMELGEVEYHVRNLLPTDRVPQIVVDVITPQATGRRTLAVFLAMPKPEDATEKMVYALKKDLSNLLPLYMVPSAFIPIALAKLPMTATGKTDRKAVRELGKAYVPQSSNSSSSSSSSGSLTPTESRLRNIWATLLNISHPCLISSSHRFADLGGDSIKTMSLAMAIRREFDVQIGVPRLVQHDNNTLRDIGYLVDNELLLRDKQVVGTSEDQDEKPVSPTAIREVASSDLEKEIASLINSELSISHDKESSVFLTGATGFLGTQILHYILSKKVFDKVIVLVRPGTEKGLERVIKTATMAGWWRHSYTSAIRVWEGDLASPHKLGLTEEQWGALCGRTSKEYGAVDAIIHNGAKVHWSTSYESLKDVNVNSTLQLLQAAMKSPVLKNFVYVSGGLFTDRQIWTDEEAQAANGYDQSKYVSERLVGAAASSKLGARTRFSVVKPGQIIGDCYSGVANADDFLWRVVMGAVRLGVRPVDKDGLWLPVADVKHVTECIVKHVTEKDEEGGHFENIKKGVWVSRFWMAVERQLRVQLRPVSWAEWMELAREDMEQDQEQERHPLWPVQPFLGEGSLGIEKEGVPGYDDEWEMREVLAAVRQNVEYLRGKGFFGRAGGDQTHRGVITRTRDYVCVDEMIGKKSFEYWIIDTIQSPELDEFDV
ncbi:Nonribosomal peptide synthase [Naviculisporaceae sp. PSN 640]